MNFDALSIPRHSWLRPGLALGDSPLEGKGVYTMEAIPEGATVIVWGGIVVTYDEFATGRGLAHSNVGLTEELCLVAPNEEGLTLDDYMNHSCNPNLWLSGSVTLIARRAIQPGEELTFDYAIEVGHESYVMKVPCRCGANDCRGQITGKDWRLGHVQEKYEGHFSPFIEARIRALVGAAGPLDIQTGGHQ